MSELLRVIGCALVAASLLLLLKQYKPEQALLFGASAGAVLLAASIGLIVPVINALTDAAGNTVYEPYMKLLLKTLGVGLAVQSAAEVCRDAGETSLASKVELAGKCEILLICLPLLRELIKLSGNL